MREEGGGGGGGGGESEEKIFATFLHFERYLSTIMSMILSIQCDLVMLVPYIYIYIPDSRLLRRA